jgi:hypothetical protein
MIKMSDVFDLPEPCTGNIHDDCAAHAINNFDGLVDALWILTEHNALHFGENNNTVIAGREALTAAKAEGREV